MSLLLKIIPALVFWGIFVFVVLQIPYPNSLTQANFIQIIPFFVFLYLALLFSCNIFLKNVFLSSSITLGLIFLLILKALDSLNLVTVILTLLAIGLLLSYFKKIKRKEPTHSGFKNLTKQSKIPKLMHMRKHHASS